MAKVFLDANYIIGLANRTPETDSDVINKHQCFISVLSCHILLYVNKEKVPNPNLKSYLEDFIWTDFNTKLLERAFYGPTDDLEDNIQLYSAIEYDCDYFLTADKKLLKLKYFGNLKIVSTLP